MVLSCDSLRHVTVTCILKTEHHRTYVIQYFRLVFEKKSHYRELVHEFGFVSYNFMFKTSFKCTHI
jgi:hypothetical protein